MLLSLTNLTKSFGERVILEDVSLSVSAGDRIGLIGPNGMGKSTLLNCICGDLEPDGGEIAVASGVRIGYLRQHSGLDGALTVRTALTQVFEPLLKAQERMRLIEQMISAAGNTPALAAEYEKENSFFIAGDGYGIDVRINTVMSGMGFTGRDDAVVSNLSGGEKTRLALAKLLLEAPDILVLDEPTNHLDFRTLSWLEDFLKDYKGALLTVSHDRYFLDKRTTKIWELEDRRVRSFRGNYSAYKLQKAELVKTLTREYEKQSNRIASMEDFVKRNIARASSANMAKSRLHQLEHIERIEKPRSAPPTPHFSFSYSVTPVKDVLTVEKLTLAVGEKERILAENVNFSIKRGEKVAILGANGTGKTTLMRTLLAANPHSHGFISWGKNVRKNYFEQENDAFDYSNNVLQELWRHYPGENELAMRSCLGSLLFTGEDVYRSVSVLSGGERARLKFAILSHGDANTLLFDEPTNHLDLPAREALEDALREFDGTLIFVSHDRYFINSIATRVLELENGELTSYQGNFDAYTEQKKLIEDKAQAQIQSKPRDAEKPTGAAYHRTKQERAEEARRRRRITELEKLVESAEEAINRLTAELADKDVACDYVLSAQKYAELEETTALRDEYMTEWLTLCD